jgi:hypothetical protein
LALHYNHLFTWCYITIICSLDATLQSFDHLTLHYNHLLTWCYITIICSLDATLQTFDHLTLHYNHLLTLCYITIICSRGAILPSFAHVVLHYSHLFTWCYITIICSLDLTLTFICSLVSNEYINLNPVYYSNQHNEYSYIEPMNFTTTYAISAYHNLYMLWVRISIRERCTTLCDKVCQWLVTGRWFWPGPPVSSTNETARHDTTEILLKVALNTIKQTNKQTHNEQMFFNESLDT